MALETISCIVFAVCASLCFIARCVTNIWHDKQYNSKSKLGEKTSKKEN